MDKEELGRLANEVAAIIGHNGGTPLDDQPAAPKPVVRRVYSIEEVAKLLGISRVSAYRAAGEDRLPVPTIRIGSRMVVARAALDRVLEGAA